jgi:hypothetical protein
VRRGSIVIGGVKWQCNTESLHAFYLNVTRLPVLSGGIVYLVGVAVPPFDCFHGGMRVALNKAPLSAEHVRREKDWQERQKRATNCYVRCFLFAGSGCVWETDVVTAGH